jgi:translation elongation factor P/translation initiation factor 5A
MVIASELRTGMVIRIEEQPYKVLEVESRAGAAKMGGVVKAKLRGRQNEEGKRNGRGWVGGVG